MIGRIVRSTDFERVLGAPTRSRSPHFAVHHLVGRPSPPGAAAKQAAAAELSTAGAPPQGKAVDDLEAEAQLWLGAVVPKRHARRAVTRSLLKRQIRAALDRHAGLPGGLWVVRLRAPFDPDRFASAASRALRDAARDELDAMLAAIVRRPALP